MSKLLALAGSVLMMTVVSANAADTPAQPTPPATHSADSMTSGSHAMPAQKQMHMSDHVMPSKSKKCSDEELAKMPADHRAACGK